MAETYICDVCDKRIKRPIVMKVYIGRFDLAKHRYDVCNKCWRGIVGFMDSVKRTGD